MGIGLKMRTWEPSTQKLWECRKISREESVELENWAKDRSLGVTVGRWEDGQEPQGINKVEKRLTFLTQGFAYDSFQKLSGKLIGKVCLVKEKETKSAM